MATMRVGQMPAQAQAGRLARRTQGPARLVVQASADKEAFAATPAAQSGAAAPKTKLIDMSKGPGVTRRQLVTGAAAGIALAPGCPCCPAPAYADGPGAPNWDYDISGPREWTGTCSAGGRQSPVNLQLAPGTRVRIPGQYISRFGEFNFKYNTDSLEGVTVLNTGHGTMQVNFPPGNITTVAGVDIELLQFHFHTPSEHAIDNRRAPMEVHLVHKKVETGGLVVIGVMMEPRGKANPTLQAALEFAPMEPRATANPAKAINPMMLLPAADAEGHRPYIYYQGSLTTPPCSEQVDWFVMTEPIRVQETQILDFMLYVGKGMTYGHNSRPLQNANEREFHYEL